MVISRGVHPTCAATGAYRPSVRRDGAYRPSVRRDGMPAERARVRLRPSVTAQAVPAQRAPRWMRLGGGSDVETLDVVGVDRGDVHDSCSFRG